MDRQLLYDYDEIRPALVQLEEETAARLQELLKDTGIRIMALEHRVKGRNNLSEKLRRREGQFHTLSDVTDLVGMRIICYFADDVDKVSALIEQHFQIDKTKSGDRGSRLSPTAFGYLSVHYICRQTQPVPGLEGFRFEIQIRSTLQHVWAEIEHDLGYKSEFAVPQTVRRSFARVAGLLEIADEQFSVIRGQLKHYGDEVRERIRNDCAGDLPIDLISLTEYMHTSIRMQAFLDRIAQISGAEIQEISPENYIRQLDWLGVRTLGALGEMLTRDEEKALQLTEDALGQAQLDILASSAALRFLCQAELINGHYTQEQMTEFLLISVSSPERAQQQAERLYGKKQKKQSMA